MTNRPLSLLAETKSLLRQTGLHARKGLGQHFLIDGAYLKHMLTAAEIHPNDIVIEVGPGLGVLTRALAEQRVKIIAIEKDEHLAGLLKTNFQSSPNVTIINRDILEVNLPEVLGLIKNPDNNPFQYKVVANLPYYITSPVLRFFLEASHKPDCMVVMVQKEVARQIIAKPGDMSLLSVGIQIYGDPKIVKYVPARAFYPPPEVDSAILRISVYDKPAVDVDIVSFFTLVRAGFSAARKQIVNPLSHVLDIPKQNILSMLEKADIDPQRRAETLSMEEWGRLWYQYTKAGTVE
jgi:16S rRNA (adenine1518-N6/adenine1519-N6)-dimethyltransferase